VNNQRNRLNMVERETPRVHTFGLDSLKSVNYVGGVACGADARIAGSTYTVHKSPEAKRMG